jgi:hypothetical protein
VTIAFVSSPVAIDSSTAIVGGFGGMTIDWSTASELSSTTVATSARFSGNTGSGGGLSAYLRFMSNKNFAMLSANLPSKSGLLAKLIINYIYVTFITYVDKLLSQK